jgi:hypothetical protein
MTVRLVSYTRYGPMVGCLVCGKSWLVSGQKHTRPQHTARPSA